MPALNLFDDLSFFSKECNRLNGLILSSGNLAIVHKKLVSEIIMIRLFLLGENTISSVCRKMLCGARYLDGTVPNTLVRASSPNNADTLMRTHGRRQGTGYLQWGAVSKIRGNIRYTIDNSDPFFLTLSNHNGRLDEMRFVRNHIAHRSRSTAINFRFVVRSHFGGLRRQIGPSVLLLRKNPSGRTQLEDYILQYGIIVRDLVRA